MRLINGRSVVLERAVSGGDTDDIDVILATQALTLGIPDSELVIATSNAAHISRFAPADLWSNIKP